MISLDEDFIGTSNSTIVVHGLKVCGGVLARLASNRLLGAHFTSITTAAEILVGCTYTMNTWANGSAVTDLYFIANLEEWQKRADKYANTHTLLRELKDMFRFNGQIWVFDKNIIGPSVDVRIAAAGGIFHRATPTPNPTTPHPKNDVKIVRTPTRTLVNGRHMPVQNGATPVVEALGGIYVHKVQTTADGWTAFAQGEMVPV
ncbi:hypothetical protein [Belnapia sp. F-4-1]|uniref:hypothetical protein n=1 Tax=Belnapia sp. F-4-1 TaxID=1545443 RepID=UPI0005B9075E|nr:hypothetical protein [Belnapia sp. F-4-1]